MKLKKLCILLGTVMMTLLVGCGQNQSIHQGTINNEQQVDGAASSEQKEDEQTDHQPTYNTEIEEAQVSLAPDDSTIDLSEYSNAYIDKLKQIQDKYNEYCMYTVYDIDGSGIKELITIEGTCEADYLMHFYKYDLLTQTVCELEVDQNIGNAALYKDRERIGIVAVSGSQDYQLVTAIKIADGKIVTAKIKEGQLAEGETYYETDEPILLAMINDYYMLGESSLILEGEEETNLGE